MFTTKNLPVRLRKPSFLRQMAGLMLAAYSLQLAAYSDGLLKPNGFVDVRAGTRIEDDPYEPDQSLAELRLQLEWSHLGDKVEIMLALDGVYDDVVDGDLDLESGKGWLDPRTAWMLFSPADFMDVKLGRQILTWGTGDLLFINDLFPKDWRSFFAGRDVTYLKAPSDAMLASFFPQFGSVDVVYVPRFDADRYLTGERISYYNPLLGRVAGRDAVQDPIKPDDWFSDHELALRVAGSRGAMEWAFYGYDGFFKSPAGFDENTGRATFPELRTFGFSLRSPLGKGLINLEAGFYDSRQDRDGDNPLIPNDERRLLVGYERELKRNLSLGLQYYVEQMVDYQAYRSTLPEEMPIRDENRHVLTMRLRLQAKSQKLTCSLFTFHSPSDKDGYVRPVVDYKLSDDWLLTGGANLFWGERETSFFGQFENNSNIYAGTRFTF